MAPRQIGGSQARLAVRLLVAKDREAAIGDASYKETPCLRVCVESVEEDVAYCSFRGLTDTSAWVVQKCIDAEATKITRVCAPFCESGSYIQCKHIVLNYVAARKELDDLPYILPLHFNEYWGVLRIVVAHTSAVLVSFNIVLIIVGTHYNMLIYYLGLVVTILAVPAIGIPLVQSLNTIDHARFDGQHSTSTAAGTGRWFSSWTQAISINLLHLGVQPKRWYHLAFAHRRG